MDLSFLTEGVLGRDHWLYEPFYPQRVGLPTEPPKRKVPFKSAYNPDKPGPLHRLNPALLAVFLKLERTIYKEGPRFVKEYRGYF